MTSLNASCTIAALTLTIQVCITTEIHFPPSLPLYDFYDGPPAHTNVHLMEEKKTIMTGQNQ